MEIIWADSASKSFFEIYHYYRSEAGVKLAKRIKADIFSSIKLLTKYPHSGHPENTLADLGQHHRYLISDRYKIIYKQVSEGILVTDIFDLRQAFVKTKQLESKTPH